MSSGNGLVKGVAFCANGLEKGKPVIVMILKRGSIGTFWSWKARASLVYVLDAGGSASFM